MRARARPGLGLQQGMVVLGRRSRGLRRLAGMQGDDAGDSPTETDAPVENKTLESPASKASSVSETESASQSPSPASTTSSLKPKSDPWTSPAAEGGARAAKARPPLFEPTVSNQTKMIAYQPPYLPVPLYILVVKPTDPDSVALVERCLTEKLATMVLLEDGPVSDAEMIEAGNHLQKLCRQHEVNFVVESRVGVAGSVLSDGVQIDVRDTPGALPVRTVRSFLEDVRDDSGHGRFVLGQVVHSAEEARLADSLGADYLLVKGALSDKAEADPGDDWTSADVDPLAELARIRKSVKAHVVVTNEFCDQPGVTANSVLQCADGFQIPAQAFRKMFLTRDERSAAHLLPSPDRLVGAIALVAGCTVGAGIIALPVRTMSAGFLPTSISLVTCWLYMVLTSLLLVEMNLWWGPGANLVTMVQKTLGKTVRIIAIVVYCLSYVAMLTAYVSGGANLAGPLLSAFGQNLHPAIVAALFATVLGTVVHMGVRQTERLNTVMQVLAFFSFMCLLALGSGFMQTPDLSFAQWGQVVPALPIMVVAFTFHNVVPSLVTFLGTGKLVMQAIVIGSFIPLVLYLVWQSTILGTLQSGTTFSSASHVVQEMLMAAGGGLSAHLYFFFAQVFSLFAVAGSFLVVSLGCHDFLTDLIFSASSLTSNTTQWNKMLISKPWIRRLLPLVLVVVPPLLLAVACPVSIFVPALEFAGTLRLLLFGILPAVMVWKGRADGNKPWVPGGNVLLALVAAVAAAVIVIDIRYNIMLMHRPLL